MSDEVAAEVTAEVSEVAAEGSAEGSADEQMALLRAQVERAEKAAEAARAKMALAGDPAKQGLLARVSAARGALTNIRRGIAQGKREGANLARKVAENAAKVAEKEQAAAAALAVVKAAEADAVAAGLKITPRDADQ